MIRGGLKLTRTGGLVVLAVLSCLGVVRMMGIDDKDCGSKKWGKRGIWSNYGGISWSKGAGIEGYHKYWDTPKIVEMWGRRCQKRYFSRGFAVIGS